jgi:hypothetical protein
MGYTTDFSGRFELNKKLDDKTFEFLKKFAETRRMKRKLPSEYGIDGEFYVDGGGFGGQDRDDNIVDYNQPPRTQPGLWCQWVPSEDGMGIEWDGGEKFYEYVNWIKYIIKNFLAPKGYTLNGEVHWEGEDSDDFGVIKIKNNVVRIGRGVKDYDFGVA